MSKLLGRELTAEEQAVQSEILAAAPTGGGGPGVQVLRALAECRPEPFFGAAVSLLEMGAAGPTLQMMLLSCPQVLMPLADPERFSREQAVNACRALMRLDPQFDIRLAQLAPRRGGERFGLGTGAILRLLDILNEISVGARLVFTLNHLTKHPNPQVASKAVLLMGNRIQNPAWVENRILSADARTRANVVEALWGRRESWARRVVCEALEDPNNRVAGNALMALHFLGDAKFATLATRMLADERPAFRQTAAWVMGRSGEPGFLEVLRGARADPSADVRRSVTRALIAIRRPAVKREAEAMAALTGVVEPASKPAETVQSTEAGQAAEAPPARPVKWTPRLDGKYVSEAGA
jgi:hypothetical protein